MPEDSEHKLAVTLYFDAMIRFVTSHLRAEEAVLWPLIGERSFDKSSVIWRHRCDHQRLEVILKRSSLLLNLWVANPSYESRVALADALIELSEPLRTHLSLEDKEIAPLCQSLLSNDEWQRMRGRTFGMMKRPHIYIVIGVLRDAMSESHRLAFGESLPGWLREAWVEEGRALYERTISRVRSELLHAAAFDGQAETRLRSL